LVGFCPNVSVLSDKFSFFSTEKLKNISIFFSLLYFIFLYFIFFIFFVYFYNTITKVPKSQ